MRLLVTGGMPIAGGIVGAGAEIAFPRPTRPGDELQVVSEVTEITPSRSKSDKGIVVLRNETRNQRGEVVLVLTAKLVVPRKPQAGLHD
jgi:acyl dehydratase